MQNVLDPISFPLETGHVKLDCRAAQLLFTNSTGECYYAFKLSPFIEYLDKSVAQGPVRLAEIHGGRHFVFESADGVTSKRSHVVFEAAHVDYWVEAAPIEPGLPIACIHYGQDGAGPQAASTHALEEFFIICPDRYGSAIPKDEKICFKLGVPSFRFDKDNNFPHEGGRTIIPPYFAALRTRDEWLGVGTLEIPTSEYGLNMTFQQGRAVTDFYYGGNLSITETFTFPRITFFSKLDKLGAGRAYIDRLYADGLAVHNCAWEESWAGPIYCFFSDQMYEYQVDRPTDRFGGEMEMTDKYCNEEFLDRCLEFLTVKAIPYKIVIIDYGWFVTNGEWRPNTSRFKDFRATIKKLQAMGKKVLLWYSPYFTAEQSTNYQTNPSIGVKKRDGSPMFVVRFGSEINYQSDFTNPAMRELCRKDFEFMLGADGLDADGIKIDCTHQPPNIDSVFYDPNWGTGEMFHFKASSYMYAEAKRIKPNCCINTTAGNPFFNRTYDLHRIHDALEYNLDAYEERAWAAWFCQAGISDLDDWPSYSIFTVRANLRKIAYGVPSLYAARRRGGERKAKAPWGYSIEVRDDELELLASIFELYQMVPIDLHQDVTIDPFRKVFNRRYTTGPLSGFYAATTLCGNQAVAVYDDNAARVVSIAGVTLAVPLPPNVTNIRLAVASRTSRAPRSPAFEIVDGQIVFEATRCCGDVKYYTITYSV